MLGARASRICGENRRAQAKAKPKSSPTVATYLLNQDQIIQQWKRFSTKMISILAYITMKEVQMPAILGKAFNTLFQQAKSLPETSNEPSSSSRRQESVYRMIGREAVGSQLPPGKGFAEMTASMCEHPDQRMLRQGNSYLTWWQCNCCASRWRRFEPNSHIQEWPTEDDLVTFGEHQGKTHKQVYVYHREYCVWACRTVKEDFENCDIRVVALANYIRACVRNDDVDATFPDNIIEESDISDLSMEEDEEAQEDADNL
jgi:hypothetical protein